MDTNNVADIIEMVAAKKADVAIADSLSCHHGLAAPRTRGPKLKAILRRHILSICPNGIMLPMEQKPLADWLDRGLRELRNEERFRVMEETILDEFHGIVSKM